MVSITIRNVPEHVHDEYLSRARRRGMSLQEYVLSVLIKGAEKQPAQDVLDRIEERLSRTNASFTVEEILAARDQAREG